MWSARIQEIGDLLNLHPFTPFMVLALICPVLLHTRVSSYSPFLSQLPKTPSLSLFVALEKGTSDVLKMSGVAH